MIAALFAFVCYFYGKLITDEMPPFNDRSEKSEFGVGLNFFSIATLNVFFLIALLFFITGSVNLPLAPWSILLLQAVLFIFVFFETRLSSLRLDFFKNHQKFEKKEKQFQIVHLKLSSAFLMPFSIALFALLVYHLFLGSLLVPLSVLDVFFTVSSGVLVLLIVNTTAVGFGMLVPKPRVFLYTTLQEKPIEAYLIRWDNNGQFLRFVPRDKSSVLLPVSQILRIEYPRHSDSLPALFSTKKKAKPAKR